MGKPKKPTTGGNPIPARKAVPAGAARLKVLEPSDGTLVIRWSKFDFDGPWCLANADASTLLALMKRLSHFESMRPIDVFGTTKTYPGTDYDTAKLPNAQARERLNARGMGDETRISAIRITGEKRFWGIRRGVEFYSLFWDPHHNIWPSQLKHT